MQNAGRLRPAFALLIGLMFVTLLVSVAVAQLGEEAGSLSFSVQVGHNQTLQLHLLNEGNSSIGFQMHAQSLKTEDNQTTPTMAISPLSGVIQPHGAFTVNVTVSMPLTNTPGAVTWDTIISAVEASNTTNPGGAVLQAGVAKIVAIQAIPSTTTTIVQRVGAQISLPASALIIIEIVIIVIVVAAVAAAFLLRRKPQRGKKGVAASAKKARRSSRKRK